MLYLVILSSLLIYFAELVLVIVLALMPCLFFSTNSPTILLLRQILLNIWCISESSSHTSNTVRRSFHTNAFWGLRLNITQLGKETVKLKNCGRFLCFFDDRQLFLVV